MPNDIYPESEQEYCLDCGVEIFPSEDRSFAFGPDELMCFDCAVKRGGVYDPEEDRWIVTPETIGLPDERRPHA